MTAPHLGAVPADALGLLDLLDLLDDLPGDTT